MKGLEIRAGVAEVTGLPVDMLNGGVKVFAGFSHNLCLYFIDLARTADTLPRTNERQAEGLLHFYEREHY
jgi:hypothetical protein